MALVVLRLCLLATVAVSWVRSQCFDEVVVSGNSFYDGNLGDDQRVVSLGKMAAWTDCQAACLSHTPVCHSWVYFFANYSRAEEREQQQRERRPWLMGSDRHGHDWNAGEGTSYSQVCVARLDHYWNPQFVFGSKMVSGINCKNPPSTALPNPPPPAVQFSWDHVPVYFHQSNFTGPYNEDALKLMAKFPLVTIEKYQGPHSGYEYPKEQWVCCEEDRIVEALQGVKKINPNVTGIFYYNMVLDFPQYRLHQNYAKNESWWLHDVNGKVVRVAGDHHSAKDMLVYDTTHSAVSDLFIHACADLVPGGGVDGCFVDRVMDGIPSANVSPEHQMDLQMSHVTTMQKFQTALKRGPLVANHAYSMPGVNAAMIEGFTANEQGIATLQWSGQRGKLVEAHMTGSGMCDTDEGIQDHLAAFLIGAGDYAYFGCGPWFSNATDLSSYWKPSFDKPLGAPQGLAVKTGKVYSRKFASGTEVQFDVSTNKGSIKWAQV